MHAHGRAGEQPDLGQRIGEPAGVVEVGRGSGARVAARKRPHHLRWSVHGAGREPARAGAQRDVVLGQPAGEHHGRRRLGERPLGGVDAVVELPQRGVMDALDIGVAQDPQAKPGRGRHEWADLAHRRLPPVWASAATRSRTESSSLNPRGSPRSSSVRAFTRSFSVLAPARCQRS